MSESAITNLGPRSESPNADKLGSSYEYPHSQTMSPNNKCIEEPHFAKQSVEIVMAREHEPSEEVGEVSPASSGGRSPPPYPSSANSPGFEGSGFLIYGNQYGDGNNSIPQEFGNIHQRVSLQECFLR